MASCMYYISILAPASVNQQVLVWKHYMRDRFGATNALKSPAHVTLIPPFWQDESKETALKEFLISFTCIRDGFTVELDNFSAFKPRVLFMQVSPSHSLLRLQIELSKELMEQGQFSTKPDAREFHPHITIATRDLMKKHFEEANAFLQGQAYSDHFKTSAITLMKHNGTHWEVHFNAPFRN